MLSILIQYTVDDHRAILRQASSLIATLASASKSTISPSTSPSTSTYPLGDTTSDAELNRMRADAMGKLITLLQRNLRVRYELDIEQVVKAYVLSPLLQFALTDFLNRVLPALSDYSTQFCRATAYRLLPHLLVDADSVQRLREQPLDWYIVKCVANQLLMCFTNCAQVAHTRQ